MVATRDGYGRLIHTHGYGGYSRGCRCVECRAAKAAYMRARRAEGRDLARNPPPHHTDARGRHVAPGITHGTVFGYTEAGCRCRACTFARSAKDARRRARWEEEL